jgi:Saccharopine dehydrogenase NADP binding domain
MTSRNNETSAIAVFGAAGHTGRFVVDELERRGLRAIRIGRDAGKLRATESSARHLPARIARIADEASLNAALSGAAAVINCAGPFFDTAIPLVDAALRAGIPYLDIAPEQAVVRSIFETRGAAARAAGVAILPGAAFYGGLADLLASALVGDEDVIDQIVVAVGLDSWHPTEGTRLTGQRNAVPRVVQRAGHLQELASPAPTGHWDFPEPIGKREVVGTPLSEIITLASHLKVDSIQSWMNVEPLRDLHDSATPEPLAIDDLGRSSQQFAIDVVVDINGKHSRATATGRDIYHVTAPIVVEAVQRLLAGDAKSGGGVYALGAIFDARAFLSALGAGAMTIAYPVVSKRPFEG